MKRIIKMTVCCMAIFLLSACGEKKITVKGADGREYNTYQEACRAGDFDAAWTFVEKFEEMSMETDEYRRFIAEKVSAYTTARDFVFNAEVQLLFSDGSTEASDRIIYLLQSLPIKGSPLQEGYKGKDATTEIVDGSTRGRDFAWYCESVYSFNNKCRQIMELCVLQNNKYLADKIVKLVKPTPTSEETGYRYIVHYTNDDIDAVKKMYDEAIKSGAFN